MESEKCEHPKHKWQLIKFFNNHAVVIVGCYRWKWWAEIMTVLLPDSKWYTYKVRAKPKGQ